MRAGATVFYSIIQYLWNKGVCFSREKNEWTLIVSDSNSKCSMNHSFASSFFFLSCNKQCWSIDTSTVFDQQFDWHIHNNFSKTSNSNMIWCPKRRGSKYNSFAIFHSKSAELLMLYSVFWGLHFLTMTFFSHVVFRTGCPDIVTLCGFIDWSALLQ